MIKQHVHAQDIVNVQVDINRAVWAVNVRETQSYFKTVEERDKYIDKCLQSARDTLNKILEDEKT